MPHGTDCCFLLEKHDIGCRCGHCSSNEYLNFSVSTPVCKAPNAWIWMFFRRNDGMWYLRWTRGSGLRQAHWWLLRLVLGARLAWMAEKSCWDRKCRREQEGRDSSLSPGKILKFPR
jgi:hypothetical protein